MIQYKKCICHNWINCFWIWLRQFKSRTWSPSASGYSYFFIISSKLIFLLCYHSIHTTKMSTPVFPFHIIIYTSATHVMYFKLHKIIHKTKKRHKIISVVHFYFSLFNSINSLYFICIYFCFYFLRFFILFIQLIK